MNIKDFNSKVFFNELKSYKTNKRNLYKVGEYNIEKIRFLSNNLVSGKRQYICAMTVFKDGVLILNTRFPQKFEIMDFIKKDPTFDHIISILLSGIDKRELENELSINLETKKINKV